MPNYVSLVIVGHLTKDCEVRTSASGVTVCTGSVAWNSGSGDKRKGHFLDFACFGETGKRLAEWCGKKGAAVLLSGELEQQTWEAKDGGGTRSKHAMIVWRFENLSPREKEDAPPPKRKPAPPADDDGSIPFGWLVALPLLGVFLCPAQP